jgi:tetrapyrrole methylase family protein / MazG family protein
MSEATDKFLKTIEEIRHPERGCVWNLKQTHASLKRYLLEEMYEALEAIDKLEEAETVENYKELEEELGDLLLQIVLHSRIAEENGHFSFSDVVKKVDEKMIKRHPHVFGKDSAVNTAEVDKLWDAEKAKEKEARKSIFEGIPREMPALARAWKISKKAVKESFEWDEEEKLYGQLDSEIEELREVVARARKSGNDPYKVGFVDPALLAEAELEVGDVLFTVVNLARWFKIDPEDALRKTNNKFVKRFDKMQEILKNKNKKMKECTIVELEVLWQEAKRL